MKVVVDDRLLMKGRSKSKLAMAKKSHNGAYWVPIMEKAAAKFFGTYENIDGGHESEGIYALTGMPTITMRHNKWDYFKAWD